VNSQNTETEYTAAIGPMMPCDSGEALIGLPYDEVRQIAEDIANQVAPDLCLNASGIIDGSPIFYGDYPSETAGSFVASYAYEFIFTRTIGGIPLTVTQAGMNTVMFCSEDIPPLLEEALYIVVTEDGFDNARYRDPYTLIRTERIDPDGLLPFDKVMETAVRMLPEMIMETESDYASADRQESYCIDRICFGYIRLNVENKPGEYELVPAWDFFGSRTYIGRFYENGEHVIRDAREDYAFSSYLTINAVTGEVIDRSPEYFPD